MDILFLFRDLVDPAWRERLELAVFADAFTTVSLDVANVSKYFSWLICKT